MNPPTQDDLIPDGGTRDLGRRTVRAGAVVFTTVIVQKAVALVIVGVLARLLMPEDYGLLGMVFAMTALLSVFADLGLSAATVQKTEVTRQQVSTLFWVNVAFGVLLAAVAALLAPAIAWFYDAPELLRITLWCSLGFVVEALGTQHTALLIRQMQFGRLAVGEMAGLLVGGAVGIGMALSGHGVFALVGQMLGTAVAKTASNWLLAGWLPGLPVRRSGVRSMLKFGGYLTAFGIVNYFARNLDKVLLGRVWGAQVLGLYTRAYALMMYPVILMSSPLSRVMMPALSKLQNDPQRLQAAYLRGLRLIATVSFPMMVWLFLMADDVIAVVYGARWAGAVPIFRLLCVAGLWQGIFNATGQLFAAVGRTDRMFRAGLVSSALLAAAFLIGVRWGSQGMALAYVVGLSLILLPYLAYTYATIGLSLRRVIGQLVAPLVGSAALIPSLLLVRMFLPDHWPPAGRLFLTGTAGGIVFIAITLIVSPGTLKQTFGTIVVQLRARRRAAMTGT